MLVVVEVVDQETQVEVEVMPHPQSLLLLVKLSLLTSVVEVEPVGVEQELAEGQLVEVLMELEVVEAMQEQLDRLVVEVEVVLVVMFCKVLLFSLEPLVEAVEAVLKAVAVLVLVVVEV